MRLNPDDDIYRFEPKWFDLKGYQLPVVARYVTWAAWFAVFLPIFVVTSLVSPWGLIVNALVSAAGSVFVTYMWVADWITPENSIDAVVASLMAEGRSILHEAERVRVAKSARAATLEASRFEDLCNEREPSWNPVKWFRL